MEKADASYNVVFQYTKNAGAYEGVITWTSFKNKEDFEKCHTLELQRMEKVIAVGVSEEEAVRLVNTTPPEAYAKVAYQEAINPKTGLVNSHILRANINATVSAIFNRPTKGLDTYFVLEQIPENTEIADFREHQYQNLKRLKPEEAPNIGKVNGRDFLMGLCEFQPHMLKSQSRQQLIENLEKIAITADNAADCGVMSKTELNLRCGIRDNVYQLIDILKA